MPAVSCFPRPILDHVSVFSRVRELCQIPVVINTNNQDCYGRWTIFPDPAHANDPSFPSILWFRGIQGTPAEHLSGIVPVSRKADRNGCLQALTFFSIPSMTERGGGEANDRKT